jgi:hypothetical protein
MPDAVSDSSPLIHLAKVEALELISRLYSRVLIPPAVWREVVEESDGRPGAAEMQRAVAAGWMVKRAAKNETLVIALRQTLDKRRSGGDCTRNRIASRIGPLGRQISPPNGAAAWRASHRYDRDTAARETGWTDSRGPIVDHTAPKRGRLLH